jgi:hypothetical protein
MKKVAYLTKDQDGTVELWERKPYKKNGMWFCLGAIAGTVCTDNFLESWVEEGECIKIEISKV